MERVRQNYTVLRIGRYYRIRYYDQWDIRREISTGLTSKGAAIRLGSDWYRDGLIGPRAKGNIRFEAFAKDWWVYDSCPYVTSEKLRGNELSRSYCESNRNLLAKHILPTFSHARLRNISVLMVQEWHTALFQRHGLAPKSANNILSILSVMLGEAQRFGLIQDNPCKLVKQLVGKQKKKGILTLDEAKALFSDISIWQGKNPFCYMLANLVAACTAMRLSEIIALRVEDVKDTYLHVTHSWDETYGLKTTKTGDVRTLPLPDNVMALVVRQCKGKRCQDFVFCQTNPARPLGKKTLLGALKSALRAIGVDPSRNIGFHSWRYQLNTSLVLKGLPEIVIHKITGHATHEMTEHYTSFVPGDFEEIVEVTSKLLPPTLPENAGKTRGRSKTCSRKVAPQEKPRKKHERGHRPTSESS